METERISQRQKNGIEHAPAAKLPLMAVVDVSGITIDSVRRLLPPPSSSDGGRSATYSIGGSDQLFFSLDLLELGESKGPDQSEEIFLSPTSTSTCWNEKTPLLFSFLFSFYIG